MTFPKGTFDRNAYTLKVALKCLNLTTQERNLWARALFRKYKEKVFFLFKKGALIFKLLVLIEIQSKNIIIKAFCYHLKRINFSLKPLILKLRKVSFTFTYRALIPLMSVVTKDFYTVHLGS